jgi:nucleoside-diphosphate-sugar epimerase
VSALKVTVTGAAGRIGSFVTRALVEAGHDVVATDRRGRDDLPVPVRVADLLDREACHALVDGADAVVHLGNHPSLYKRIPRVVYGENAAMNANVFEAALERGVRRLVFASSVQAIGSGRRRGPDDPGSGLPYLPMDGRAPARPGNLYALSKDAGEQMLAYYARHHGRTCVAIRFPLTLDLSREPRDPAAPIEPDYGKLDECFAYLDVRDAASLVVAVLAAPLEGYRCYFPASRGNLAARPVAELVRDYYPTVPLRRPIEQVESLVDTSDIERETGWTPRIV